MGDTRARVCCGTACSRVTQEHAGSTDCLSEMNADLLPLDKVVTGHGGTGKWTRKKAFGFSRRVRSRPKATPMRMRYDPCKSAGKGKGRNKDKHDYFARIPGQGHARMQVRREASSCESASELLKTLTTHDAWEAHGEQIYEELRAVSEGDADKSVYYSPATGWLLEDMCSDIAVYRRAAAATRIQTWWRAKQSDHKSILATLIQACWRGYVARNNYRAAKQAKAAASRDESANQLVVGSTILGHSIANDEPQYGGKCACVGLLTGDVPPCLGGSVTVFDDAPEAFYYAAWDYCERYIDQACDVRFFDLTGSEGIFTDITSFRQLLSVGDPFDLPGNADLQTFLAERREPLGYTNTGRRLIHSQDLVFMVVAAVFMQIDVVLLDAASACPLYMIVRCRLDPRRACAPSH